MKIIKKMSLLCLFLFSSMVLAQGDEGGGGDSALGLSLSNYFDVYTYWGTGASELDGLGDSPSLNQYGIGFSWAVNTSGFLTGFGMEYRYIDHAKDFSAEAGSFKGERFVPIYLMLGYVSAPFVLKIDYQFIGDFTLENLTVSDAQIVYRNPGGYRISALYQVWSTVLFGLHYESLRYRDRLDTQNGQQVLTDGFSLNNTSLVLVYGF